MPPSSPRQTEETTTHRATLAARRRWLFLCRVVVSLEMRWYHLNTTVSCNPYRIWEKPSWGGGGGLFPSLIEKKKELEIEGNSRGAYRIRRNLQIDHHHHPNGIFPIFHIGLRGWWSIFDTTTHHQRPPPAHDAPHRTSKRTRCPAYPVTSLHCPVTSMPTSMPLTMPSTMVPPFRQRF